MVRAVTSVGDKITAFASAGTLYLLSYQKETLTDSGCGSMDSILPQANQMLKVELIQKNPDMESDIVRIVDEETLAIAPRRGDLEKEVATAFARAFSEQELNEIAAFHSSPTGQKFLTDSPIVGREVGKAVEIWQLGIARDLSRAVGTKLGAIAPNAQPPAPAEAPATPQGGAPASPALTPPAQ